MDFRFEVVVDGGSVFEGVEPSAGVGLVGDSIGWLGDVLVVPEGGIGFELVLGTGDDGSVGVADC